MNDQVTCKSISYCRYNIDDEVREVLLRCGLTIEEDFCVGCCSTCDEGPFLLIDGTLVTSATSAALLLELSIHPPPSQQSHE